MISAEMNAINLFCGYSKLKPISDINPYALCSVVVVGVVFVFIQVSDALLKTDSDIVLA